MNIYFLTNYLSTSPVLKSCKLLKKCNIFDNEQSYLTINLLHILLIQDTSNNTLIRVKHFFLKTFLRFQRNKAGFQKAMNQINTNINKAGVILS